MAARAGLQRVFSGSSRSHGGGGGGGGRNGASNVELREFTVFEVASTGIASGATMGSSSSRPVGTFVASGDGTTVTHTKEADKTELGDDWETVSGGGDLIGGEAPKVLYDVLRRDVELYWEGKQLRIPAEDYWQDSWHKDTEAEVPKYLKVFIEELQRRGLTPDQIALRLSFMHQKGAIAKVTNEVVQKMGSNVYYQCDPNSYRLNPEYHIIENLKRPVKIVMNQDYVQASGRLFFFTPEKRGSVVHKVYYINVNQKTTFSTPVKPVKYEMKTTIPMFCGKFKRGF